jgi:hypothetical protein
MELLEGRSLMSAALYSGAGIDHAPPAPQVYLKAAPTLGVQPGGSGGGVTMLLKAAPT